MSVIFPLAVFLLLISTTAAWYALRQVRQEQDWRNNPPQPEDGELSLFFWEYNRKQLQEQHRQALERTQKDPD